MSQGAAPQVSDQDEISARVRRIIAEHRKDQEEHSINVDGIHLVIHSGVFDPSKGKLSTEVLKYLDVEGGQQALDMFTGCGIYAVFMARRGAYVVATDVDDTAVSCAKENVRMHRLDGRVEVIKSDLFKKVPNRRFDLIVANPPIADSKYHDKDPAEYDHIERALLDDGAVLKGFLRNADCFLNPGGRIIMAYANTGFPELFREFVKGREYKLEILETIKFHPEEFYIFKLMK